jgi:hypothetical protein
MTTETSPVAGAQRIKQGKASLIGGAAVGVTVFALWTAIAHELAADNASMIMAGVLVAAGIATWIRVADL